jgi:hypothetical protein
MGQIVDDDGQLAIVVPLVKLRRGCCQGAIERLDQFDPCRQRFHQHTAPILSIAQPANEPGLFQAIDDRSHGARCQTRVPREASGGGRARQIQQIETFEIGRVQAYKLGDRVADEHRLRADLSERLVEFFQ